MWEVEWAICAEDSGGFIGFALTIEALHAIWFGPEKSFVLTWGEPSPLWL